LPWAVAVTDVGGQVGTWLFGALGLLIRSLVPDVR
jgi:hypothetical protein